MLVSDFDYPLPPELIAQHPATARDSSRLLVVDRSGGPLQHRRFHEIGSYLRPGDLLVANDSRVIPARLRGFKPGTGGIFELLLLEESAPSEWWVLLRPAKRMRPGTRLQFNGRDGLPIPLSADILDKNEEGHVRMRFHGNLPVLAAAEAHGEVPLPPYIDRPVGPSLGSDRERYQTVYARQPGSAAAPTAGLHLSKARLATLASAGVGFCTLTLHVGAGTFMPVKVERVDEHRMHEERFSLPAATAAAINATKAAGHRVIAVGTTSLRVLEAVARGTVDGLHWGSPSEGTIPSDFVPLPTVAAGRTAIFLRPPSRFRVVDALVTNFHLPQSTLLMLVSAFAAPGETTAGRDLVLSAYAAAVRERYRFFSYGDAMLLL